MNIAKELNILLEEFKFKPRRLQNRDQARRENELKKLKQIQKENPIGSNLGYQNLGIKTIELPRIINGSLFVKVYNENYAEEYQKYLDEDSALARLLPQAQKVRDLRKKELEARRTDQI